MLNLLKGIALLSTFIISTAYFLSCFTPYISPALFWPIAFIALGYPYILALFFITLLTWLLLNRKVGLYLLVLFLAGLQNLFSLLAFHINKETVLSKKGVALRVLAWNVRGFDNNMDYADTPNAVRRRMFAYIRETNADILCLQEFTEHVGPHYQSNTSELLKLGYRYYYKSNEITRLTPADSAYLGSAIFSKISLVNKGEVLLGDSSFPEHLLYADISYNSKKIRIFSTHLKSFNLFATTADSGYHVVLHNNNYIIYHATKFEKLKAFSAEHVTQANIVKKQLDKCPYPFVFAADMNSVPASYPYHKISNNLQDAFLQKGFGIGTTYNALSNTLRIDYLLVHPGLNISSYHKENVVLSDHYPHLVDVFP